MVSYRPQLFTVVFIALLGIAWSYDTPLLMWSGEQYFTGKNVQIESTVSNDALSSIFNRVAQLESQNLPKSVISAFSNVQSKPEVIVVYLEPMLRTDQVSTHRQSLSRLHKELSSSKTSVLIPFLDTPAHGNLELSNALVGLSQRLTSGRVIIIGNPSSSLASRLAEESPSATFLASPSELKADSPIFSNGHTDLIVVQLNHFETTMASKLDHDDKVIASFQDLIEDATDGNYISIFSAEHAPTPVVQIDFANDGSENRQIVVNRREAAQNPPEWEDYFPAWFWEVFLWMAMWILIALIAVFSLFGMQTPTTFLSDKKKND